LLREALVVGVEPRIRTELVVRQDHADRPLADEQRHPDAGARGDKARDVTVHLGVVGSNQTLEEFIGEWWEKHAVPVLAPGTLASYVHPLDKWIVPYLGRLRMRDLTREAIDGYRASLVAAGAGAPTVNRCLGILQGILQRAVEWRRISGNPRYLWRYNGWGYCISLRHKCWRCCAYHSANDRKLSCSSSRLRESEVVNGWSDRFHKQGEWLRPPTDIQADGFWKGGDW